MIFCKKIKIILQGRAGKDYYIYKLLRISAILNEKTLPSALNEYLISSGVVREMFNCQLEVKNKKSSERNSRIIIYTPSGSSAFVHAAVAKELNWNDKKIGTAVAPYSGRLKKGEILLTKSKIILRCLNKKGEICADGQKKYVYKIKYNDEILISKSSCCVQIIGFSPNLFL